MTVRKIDFKYAPPSSWTSICRPDDPYKSLVRDDGALMYGFHANTFDSWFFDRVFEFSIHAARTTPKITQKTESSRVPVVITTLEYPRATLELRAFGHLHGENRRTDVVLWSIRAHGDVDEVLTAIHLDIFEMNKRFVGRSEAASRTIFAVAPDLLPEPDRWAATQALDEDDHLPKPGEIAMVSSPQPLMKHHTRGFVPASGLSSAMQILHAGESMEGAFMIPLNHEDVSEFNYEWALNALDAERNFWNTLSLSPLKIEVPDEALMDMILACSRNILQAREIEDGLPVFKVGPTVYRNLFVIDGHFMLETAQILGYHHEARAAIQTLLRRVRPNGAIAQMIHHTKETGISIATLIRQCELLNDEPLLRDLWQTIRNGVTYIEGLRAQAKALPADHPCHNLLPIAFGDGGVGGDRGEYTTVLWILFGLKSAAEAAQRLGFDEDAQRFSDDFEELLTDFRAHATKNMGTLPDGTAYLPICFEGSGEHHWIPNYPYEVKEWNRLRPESATWALCQAIWPGEVFAPDDEIVKNLNHLHDLIDDEEGIPSGTGWLPYKSLWSYHASFAAHVWLYSNRPDKALDYLYDFANHASPTRVWREEQSLTSTQNGQLFGEMPHNWASAEFIRLVRHLLVFERGNALELLRGFAPEWIKPQAKVQLEKTPTRFGPVSLVVESPDGMQVDIKLEFDASWPLKPANCVLYLPKASQVSLNGQALTLSAEQPLHLALANQLNIEVVSN